MNLVDLKGKLNLFLNESNQSGISIYVILKERQGLELRKLDIERAAEQGLKDLFTQSLRAEIVDNEDLSILNLSTSDERINAVYVYDLEVPKELQVMESVTKSDDIPKFDFSENQLSRVKALLVKIGNNDFQIVLYKSMAPVNVFKQSSFFLKKSDQRFERITDEFVRISSGFQLLRVDDTILVIDIMSLEKLFGFYEIIRREALAGIGAIEQTAILEDVDGLTELIDDIGFARKLTKVAKSSPVIASEIPSTKIISFCKTFPQLRNKIRFSDTGNQIRLDTRVSKDLFIKLLMDDFLTSELTEYHYTSEAKTAADESGTD